MLQLNLELQLRAKWEAVRLADVIEQYEQQWVERFEAFAAKANESAQGAARVTVAAEQERLQVREEVGICVWLKWRFHSTLPLPLLLLLQVEFSTLIESERRSLAEDLTREANTQLRAALQVGGMGV